METKVNPAAQEAAILDAIIIIFGAAVRKDGTPSPTLRHRVEAAARFGRRFARPLFIPTGGKGRHGDAEAIVMARLLTEAGFPEQAILTEETGTDTLSSVRAVRRLLPPALGIYAATSAYHLPRCLLLLRLAGIRARACPPPPVPASTSLWLRWFWRLRETAALPYDALLMLWLRVTGGV
ncbi:YdcF family protein [Rhodopila sp.]|uniref:YdcF family protein n=1 Tax=Rhodopila sp. TaxID=2480087 RepID=UPI003D113500